MRPTEVLMEEHRVIEQVLDCLERMADDCEAGQPFDIDSANLAIDFIRTFADRCHHAKEEDLLFPLLEHKGFSREQGPTGVMLHEHEQGRHHVRAMSDAMERIPSATATATGEFVEHARAFVQLLRQHIFKEDHCLFPMADEAFSAIDQDELGRSFSKVQHEDLGSDIHEKYLRIADRLADRFGVSKAALSSGESSGACGHLTMQIT